MNKCEAWRSLDRGGKAALVKPLIAKGLSYRACARELGVSVGAIAGVLNRLRHPKVPRKRTRGGDFSKRRGRYTIASYEEDELLQLFDQGVPRRELAERFDCQINTIYRNVNRITLERALAHENR